MKSKKHKRILRAIALGLGAMLLLIPLIALGNAPPPPPMTWIDFQNWPESIDAVQVIECQSQQCTQPKLFAEYKKCVKSSCITPPPKDELPEEKIIQLSCKHKTCLMAGDTYEAKLDPNIKLKLRLLSGDRTWNSDIITEPEQLEKAWLVSRSNTSLQVDLINPWERDGPPTLFWGMGFLLTLCAEILVLTLWLKFMNKKREFWSRTFVSFGLMHLVTYPLVWSLPIGLLPFQGRIERFAGIGVLLIALIYLGFLFPLRKMVSWKLVLLSLLLLSCTYFALGVTAFLYNYGQVSTYETGLTYNTALAITEGTITILEAGFLSILSRGKITLFRAGILSLLMNGTSWILGVLLWQLQL